MPPATMPIARALAASATLLALAPALSAAQTARRPALSVGAGVSQYDLSGTGTAPMLSARVDYPLRRALLLEAGLSAARPEQQFGGRSTLLVPELGVQLQYPARVAPYLGLGVGAAVDVRSGRAGGARTDLTASGAAGVRAWLTDRLGVRGELRVRGIGGTPLTTVGTGFDGSAAEWTVGGTLRL